MTQAKDRTGGGLSYGWVVLGVSTIVLTMAYGLMFSYGVFFAPLSKHFHWDRTQTSFVYSTSLLLRGLFSIAVGWCADKFGPRVLLAVCGGLVCLGFVASSQVHTLWQFFITYGIILALGLSGAFGISSSLVAQWFTKRGGLALGILSMGSGLGTLIVVPISALLIKYYAWSTTFIVCGVGGGLVMIAGALLMREAPKKETGLRDRLQPANNVSFAQAIRHPELYLVSMVMFIYVFCAQVIMIHFVNYATDLGMTALQAAGIISIIGLVSMVGRLITGFAADKTDILNLMLIAPLMSLVSFLILIFFKTPAALYVFAVIYALAYGAEVPLTPMAAKRYFGTKSLAALVGVFLFAGGLGGAAGPLVAGKTFDMTHSYESVFIIGAVILVLCVIPIAILKARARKDVAAAKIAQAGVTQ